MITGLNHITLTTKDVTKSFEFYKSILRFKPVCLWDNGAYFELKDGTWFCLNYDENTASTLDYTHIAFSVSLGDFTKIRDIIIANGVTIFQENKSEGHSLYFLDPDGHKLELHVGNLQSRLEHKKQNLGSWKNVTFFS